VLTFTTVSANMTALFWYSGSEMRYLLALAFLPSAWRIPVYALLGVFAGLGLATVRVSEAQSYLSDNPRACINCHVMTTQYMTWEYSSHANVAVCVDCHVPHTSLLAKYAYKAKDGLRHTTIFTLGLEPQVIRASKAAEGVIQANCIRCHSRQLAHAGTLAAGGRKCLDCHRETPHGPVDSLSATPNARRPALPPVSIVPHEQGGR
jgi:cytochrome c nitrite reductase small subunit